MSSTKRAKTAIEGDQLLGAVLDNPHLLVAYLDCELNFIRVNRAYAEADEREPSFFPGKNHFDLYPNEENERIFRMVVETGEPYFVRAKPFEYKKNKERGISWWDWNLVPVKDDDGRVTALVLTLVNVTEHKRAEEKIHLQSEIMKNMVEGVYLVGADDGIIRYCNPEFERMFGCSPSEMNGKHVSIVNAPAEKAPDETAKEIMGILDETGEWHGEINNIKKDGTSFWCHASCSMLQHPEFGRVIVAVHTDITERKEAEKALRESEENFRSIYNAANDAIFVHEMETGRIIDVNRKMCEMYGYTPEEARLIDVEELSSGESPYDQERAVGLIKKAVAGEPQIFEWRARDKAGRLFWVEVNLKRAVIGEQDRILAIVRDITERKRAEEALRESEERYHRITDAVTDYIYAVRVEDGQPAETIHGHACEAVTGYSSEEFRIDPYLWIQMIPQEDRDRVRDQVSPILSGNDPEPIEHRLMRKDGCVRWVRSVLVANRDGRGNLLSYDGLIHDITERKLAEEALLKSEKKFKRITEHIYDVIMVANLEGDIDYVSPSIIRVLGYQPEELIGKNIIEFVPKSEIPHVIETFRLSAAGKDVEGHHCEFIKKDGSIANIELNAVPIIESDEIVGAQAIIRDITETKRLQALESRAERLETAGTIAGQVAHDFNNLLAPIMAYPEFIREELPRNHPTLQYLDHIEKAALKIADINQDLLAMGRRGHYNQDALNLNTVIQHALSELEPYSETLACEMDLSDDLMDILGGGAQLHRMISNLLHNAKDAMQDIGQITVKTENYYVDDVSVAYGRVPKGEYVKLTISDTGCGIPDDIVQKIFDPFFTSKTTDKKRGSGLGMSVVDAVIKDHNGYIDLSTKVGQGTSFYIYFPITRESMDSQDLSKTCGGSETILVVDDDDVQREVSTQLLKKLGYEVNTAESGEKAIEFLRENPQDLVILDMIMPGGINGAETYERALNLNSEQKAIIVSGFAESDRVATALKMGVGAFVKKPLTRRRLAVAVRGELDKVTRPVL